MDSLRRTETSIARRTLLKTVPAAATLALLGRARAEETRPAAPATREARALHGVAMHGRPALPPDFEHLPYVRPDAPKGGRITYGWPGSYDTLNPFVYRGQPAQGLRGFVYESLLARSFDEPFSLYGLVAETLELPEDRGFVTFHLDARARFSDGRSIGAEDVLFTFQLLRDHGHPSFRANYRRVLAANIVHERSVRFDLPEEDRELPLILGLMPVFSAQATDPKAFENTSFKPMLGSGPYIVSAVDPQRSVTFRRDPNYWGRDLPVNRGVNNFDEIRYDYYRDDNSMFEAFKKGLVDIRMESDPIRWTTGYAFPAAERGEVVAEGFTSGMPWGMNGFVFNTRKRAFADIRTREALCELFDYEWIDRNLYAGETVRTQSYFEGSELASYGLSADERERELLAPFPNAVRADILERGWRAPVSDGSGRDRDRLRTALDLLKSAGWTLKGGELVREDGGAPLRFEFLVDSRDHERLALAFARNVERAGVKARVRLVDSVELFRRRQTYDFDMIIWNWYSSLSPGLEQRKFWGQRSADTPGERNYMGAKEPAIDAMIDAMIAARERPDFVSAVRALDRVLLSGFYVIPLFHQKQRWIARWRRIERPDVTPLFGPTLETWWRAPATTG